MMQHIRMSTREGKKPRISVPLAPEDRALLGKMAHERDRSVGWLAAHAIRFYLAEARKGSQLALHFERADGD